MISYQKHEIQCRCILNQFKNHPDPPLFYFVVFSKLENNKVIEKKVKCENCGIIHIVNELCKSTILDSESENIVGIDDIKLFLPDKLNKILDDYSCALHLYEEALFVIENKKWNKRLILTKESINTDRKNYYEGKLLIINSEFNYTIDYWKSSY